MDKLNKLSLPATILLASFILDGFYFATETRKQESIERQQQIELQTKIELDKLKTEEDKATQLQAQKQAVQLEFDKQTEIYRKECIVESEKLAKQFTVFLNTCTGVGGNSETFCLDSGAGKSFSLGLREPISTCVNRKRNSVN